MSKPIKQKWCRVANANVLHTLIQRELLSALLHSPSRVFTPHRLHRPFVVRLPIIESYSTGSCSCLQSLSKVCSRSLARPLPILRPTTLGVRRLFKKLPKVWSGTIDTVSCHMPDMVVAHSRCNMPSLSGSLQGSCRNCLAPAERRPSPALQVGEGCL